MPDKPITSIAELRSELGLTLEAFGAAIGLKSKGQVSLIEETNKCSPAIALEIEKLSGRRLDAASLNGVVEAARRSIAA
jgi:DNA-binding XRE family transcriptional regulator